MPYWVPTKPGQRPSSACLMNMWSDFTLWLMSRPRTPPSRSTAQLGTHLQAYLQKAYRVSDVSIKRIDHSMIEGFEHFLKTEKGCSHNTQSSFFKTSRRLPKTASNAVGLQKIHSSIKSLSLKEVSRPYLNEEELKRSWTSTCE